MGISGVYVSGIGTVYITKLQYAPDMANRDRGIFSACFGNIAVYIANLFGQDTVVSRPKEGQEEGFSFSLISVTINNILRGSTILPSTLMSFKNLHLADTHH